MAKKDRYLVALDIGSTKTCALIADIENGITQFMAMGAAESKGSRKGLIVNLDAAVTSIRRALESLGQASAAHRQLSSAFRVAKATLRNFWQTAFL